MANRVTGLQIEKDVVRAVVLQMAFRSFELVEVYEEAVIAPSEPDEGATPPMGTDAVPDDDAEPPSAAPETEASDHAGLPEPVRDAIRRLADRGAFASDAVYTAMDVTRAYLVSVTLPFRDRNQIDEVLIHQLDGRLPTEVEEMHLDFLVGGTVDEGGNLIHAAAIRPEDVERFLNDLDELGIDPPIVDVEPGPLAAATQFALGTTNVPVATLEIGRENTSLVVVHKGHVELMRSMHVGWDAMARRLADGFGLDLGVAREGLLREGALDPAAAIAKGAQHDDAWRTADLLRQSMRTLLRELRGSLLAHGSQTGRPVERLLLTGEIAAMPGLAEHLHQALGIEVETLYIDRPETAGLAGFRERSPVFANALGIALRAAGWLPGSGFNLRKGEFAFRGSLEFLVSRIPSFGAMALVLIAAGVVMFAGRFALLNAERAELDRALGDVTQMVFNERLTSPGSIRSQLTNEASGPALFPSKSAFELFVDTANVIGDMQLDGVEVEARVMSVDMARFLLRLEGIAPNAESVDTLQAELESNACFRNIQRNDLSRNRDGAGFRYALQGVIDCGGENEGNAPRGNR